MRCATCGTENEAGRKFCRECGSRLAAVCPNCGSSNAPDAKFCGECGTTLAPGAAAQPGVARAGEPDPAAPGRAASVPAEATTERRLVSVLFADLVGFTRSSERSDAEDVREFLDRYFAVASTVIARYGGTIEKFIGDAVMAVWGTPIAHEDDAERAVRAALELVSEVGRVALAGSQTEHADLRAAVLTGEVAVTLGAVGQGMVAGDLVNTAARLQGVAEPGTVLVDETTRLAASEAIAFEAAGDRALRGKTAPIPAWRALRVVAERGGAGRAERLEAPFVGRESELRLLKELLHSTTQERRARLASVIGIAGVGKSRLAWELRKYVDGIVETVYWHEGRSPAYGEGVTFWALGEMVRARAGIAEADDPVVTRAKLADALREWIGDDDERRWVEPRLAVLLALEEGHGPPEELFAAWRRFFERVAERGTTVLVFEDLQWADPGLIDFIESILEWSRSHPILIITLARPELYDRRAGWGAGQRDFTALFLDPLPEDAMRALLEGLVAGLEPQLVERILERAEGVPLYAVETVRMLVDAGRLTARPDGYGLAGPIDGLEVPATLHALISARLDGLEPRDRELLQTAAVLGLSFDLRALASLAGDDERALEERLRRLARRELVRHNADPRSPERGQYTFVQSMIREVAYGTLARRERRSRHLAAARHYESLGDEELAGVLASHYMNALAATAPGPEADALSVQTRLALKAAAERASALHSPEQALAFYEQALSVTADPGEELALHERAAAAARSAAAWAKVEQHLEASATRARERGDLAALARSLTQRAGYYIETDRAEGAVAELDGAMAELKALGSHPDLARAVAELARGLMMTERAPRALEVAERALEMAGELDLPVVVAEALTTRGALLKMAGRGREGTALLIGAVAVAQAAKAPRTEIRARFNTWDELVEDDPAVGLATARVGLELAIRLGQRDWTISSRILVAVSETLSGNWDAAERVVRDNLAEDLAPPDRGNALGFLAVLEASRGAIASAVDRLGEATPLVEQASTPQARAIFELNRAQALLAAGRYEDAYEVLDRGRQVTRAWDADYALTAAHAAIFMRDASRLRHAIELYDTDPKRGRWFKAHRSGLGASLAALEGRRSEAISAFGETIRLWREITAPFDLALTELFLVLLVGGSDPEVVAAASEARAILTGLGASAYLERLEPVLTPAALPRA